MKNIMIFVDENVSESAKELTKILEKTIVKNITYLEIGNFVKDEIIPTDPIKKSNHIIIFLNNNIDLNNFLLNNKEIIKLKNNVYLILIGSSNDINDYKDNKNKFIKYFNKDNIYIFGDINVKEDINDIMKLKIKILGNKINEE